MGSGLSQLEEQLRSAERSQAAEEGRGRGGSRGEGWAARVRSVHAGIFRLFEDAIANLGWGG